MRIFVIRYTVMLRALLFSFAIIATAACGKTPALNSFATPTVLPTVSLTIEQQTGQRLNLIVEIADSDEERRRGLMQRTALGETQGMWFIFEQSQPLSFWMFNTLIPLDIIYLDSNYTIVSIAEGAQPCGETQAFRCPTYASEQNAQYVLEVNAGFAQRYGIQRGDRVVLK